MAIAAVKPLGVGTVREAHKRHITRALHDHIGLELSQRRAGVNLRTRLDPSLAQRLHPIDLIAAAGGWQAGEGFGGILQTHGSRVLRIVPEVQGLPPVMLEALDRSAEAMRFAPARFGDDAVEAWFTMTFVYRR